MSTKARKIAKLRNKRYRDAFVGSQISVGLPFQIRALREQRGWKQSRLAMEANMLQPRISAMESPGGAKFNIETLRRLASAFDVAIVVRFVPFTELIDWSDKFNPDTFRIASFEEDIAANEGEQKSEQEKVASTSTLGTLTRLANASVGDDLSWLGNSLEVANNTIAAYAQQQPLRGLGLAETAGIKRSVQHRGELIELPKRTEATHIKRRQYARREQRTEQRSSRHLAAG